MIRVTLEMVPHGDESKTRQIGALEVWHVSENAEQMANYEGLLLSWHENGPVTETKVSVHKHWRPAGAWQLVMLALQSVLTVEAGKG